MKNIITFIFLILLNSFAYASEVSFASEQLLSIETNPNVFASFSNIDSSDIDGDGDIDIIISQINGSNDEISWLENDGGDLTGFPQHIISTATTQGFVTLKAVDLDGDGDIDVVGTDKTSDEILWFENDGTATIWTSQVIFSGATVNNVKDLSVADIDGDGDLDIVVAADTNPRIYWYKNGGGAATWTEHDMGIITAGNVSAIATGDVTADGSIDIVYGLAAGSPYIRIVRNVLGDGSTWTASTVATGSSATIRDIQVEDLDLNGLAEIYYHGNNDDLIQLTYNTATFTWDPLVIATSTRGEISFIDFDMDGDKDILVGNGVNFSWYDNSDGMGGSWMEHVLISGLTVSIESVTATDLDNDGDMEIVLAKKDVGFIAAYENLLFHSSTQYDLSTAFDNSHTDAYHVVTGLLNGDQYQDIVSANKSATGMEIFFFAGDGTDNYNFPETVLSVASTTDSQITAIKLGDMDKDGDLDIVFAADGNDNIYMIENLINAGPFTSQSKLLGANWGGLTTLATASGRSEEIQLEDINADGMLDVVILDKVGGRVIWLDNDGVWTQHVITSTYSSPGSFDIADFNGDGSLDVVVAGSSSSTRWFSNDTGDGLAWTESTLSSNTGYQIDVADMDFDGDMDVVTSRNNNLNITWYANNGSGTAWSTNDTLINTGSYTRELAVLDVDADGDLDILTQHNNGDFYLIEYDQSNMWSKRVIKSGLQVPSSFAFIDYDLDGDLDVISKGTISNELITIENRGGQFSLSYTSAPTQSIEESETRDVFSFIVMHNGELLDADMQISMLNIGFQPGINCNNLPMISSEINPLISEISLYLDNGSGAFEVQLDTPVFTQTGPLTLTAGQISLNLPDQDNNLQISPQMSNTYFVTFKIRPNASAETCRSFVPFFFVGNTAGILDNFTAQDRDSNLTLRQAYTTESIPALQSIVPSTNGTPTTSGIANKNAMASILFTADISADFSDPDGDSLAYSAAGLPLSLSINTSTGVISGTPTNIEVANSPFTITVVATDPQGASANSNFSLVVNPFLDLIFANGME